MMKIREFKKLSPLSWVFWTIFLLTTIAPGALAIFSFREDLFLLLDIFKLMLLSMSITFPVWIFNIVLVSLASWDDSNDDGTTHLQTIGAWGGTLSTIPLYIPSFAKLALGSFLYIPSVYGLILGFVIQMVIVVILGIKIYRGSKDQNSLTFTI